MPVSNPNVTRVASEPQLTRQERRSDFSFHQSPPNSEEHLLVKSSEKDAKQHFKSMITLGKVEFCMDKFEKATTLKNVGIGTNIF